MGLSSRSHIDRSGDDSISPPPARNGRTARHPHSLAPDSHTGDMQHYLDKNRHDAEELLGASGSKILHRLTDLLQLEGFIPHTPPPSSVSQDLYRQERSFSHFSYTPPDQKNQITCDLSYRVKEVAERRWRVRFGSHDTNFSADYTGSPEELLVHAQRYSIKLRSLRQGGFDF